eukprot:scaffold1312_cov393-Prasinococcus_capsulatus_cf.AAC.9
MHGRCGSGMIPLEAATGLGGQAMAGDMHHIAVDAADKNTQIANRDFKAACDVLRWDAANLPLREGMIDAYVRYPHHLALLGLWRIWFVASDFPFGQRCGSPKVRVQLYQNSMRVRQRTRMLRRPPSRSFVSLVMMRDTCCAGVGENLATRNWSSGHPSSLAKGMTSWPQPCSVVLATKTAPGILRSTFGNWLAVENSFQIDMEGLIAEVMILKRTPSPAPKPMRQTRCERDAKRQWRPTADSTTAQAADAV